MTATRPFYCPLTFSPMGWTLSVTPSKSAPGPSGSTTGLVLEASRLTDSWFRLGKSCGGVMKTSSFSFGTVASAVEEG